MNALIAAALLLFQVPPEEQKKIDEAIKKGSEWLLKRFERNFDNSSWNATVELVLLTLSHANVPTDNPVFQKGLEKMLASKLTHTYRVAMHAMALQRLDAEKHRERIAHCAQWLVDTQCADGEWGYPGTLSGENEVPKSVTVDPPKLEEKKDKKSGDTAAKLVIRRRLPPGKAKGDISNAQFALLGLKACEESGIEIPDATWKAALAYHLKTQSQDGGWGYYFNGMKDKARYGSMTCAGVCAVAICRYYLGMKDPSKDVSVQRGLGWLAKNWTVQENPGVKQSNIADPDCWQYYYLYSIERVGKVLGTEKIGPHLWYPEGAKWLLEKQKADGSWWMGLTNLYWKQAGDLETADTCFAILFLSKATRPLVVTGDTKRGDTKKE